MVNAKVYKNKNNGQLTVMLPKSKLNFLKKTNPKFMKLDKLTKEDFE